MPSGLTRLRAARPRRICPAGETAQFLKDVLTRVPRKARAFVSALVRSVFQQPTLEAAREAVMSFPEAHREQIRSTNPLERLGKEIRRRTNVVGIFPTESSVLKMGYHVLVPCVSLARPCWRGGWMGQSCLVGTRAPRREIGYAKSVPVEVAEGEASP